MNFADPLRLGPLDPRAATALATRPLEALGIRFESDELVEELLRRTGRRPNLVATACDAMLPALPPLGERRLGSEVLHAVLDVTDSPGQQVAQALGSLGNLVGDPRACAVDRMVMFATVERETFTADDVRSRLERHGARLAEQDLRESLQRLALAYVIEKESGQYRYPVPLVRDFLLDEALSEIHESRGGKGRPGSP